MKGFSHILKKGLYKIFRPFIFFFKRWFTNSIINKVPSYTIRKTWYRMIGMKIGKGSFIDMNCYFLAPNKIKLGDNVHINQGCFLDARGGLFFEDNVSVSHYSKFITGGHDWNDPEFKGIFKPIIVKEYVWVGVQCVILQNVTLGEGCVIASCSLINRDTETYSLYGGVPAKKIRDRNKDQKYHPLEGENHFRFF